VRVLLTSANFRPHVGGIERFTETLAGALAARGHRITVLCCRSGAAPTRERLDGFEVVRVASSYALEKAAGVPYPLPSPALVATLRRLVADSDVVHVQDALYATSVAALLEARRRGVPSVLTQHVGFVAQRRRLLDAAQRAAIATLGRDARLATLVATLNPAVAEWAAHAFGIPEPRVLPVGVASPAPAGERRTLRASFGLPADRFLALFVGRDVPKKGLDVFLGAGDPAYDLVAVTDRTTAASGARLLPFMPPERLRDLLACVDAFVLPSEAEGFPLSLQEAFAAGLPAVTTMQPGYDQYLDADDVMVVERDPQSVRRALLAISENEEMARRLSARSRALAERHFGLDRFASAYETLYSEAIATRL
jgi:glycosyltransferase involved in cell wall biosynthesis